MGKKFCVLFHNGNLPVGLLGRERNMDSHGLMSPHPIPRPSPHCDNCLDPWHRPSRSFCGTKIFCPDSLIFPILSLESGQVDHQDCERTQDKWEDRQDAPTGQGQVAVKVCKIQGHSVLGKLRLGH